MTERNVGKYKIVEYRNAMPDELCDCWKTLERGRDMTAFQSCDWHLNLLALHKTERMKNLFRKLCYFMVSNEEKPVLIAPLEIHWFGLGYKQYGAPRGVYFIGRMGYTDYLNFIYDEFDPAAMEVLLEYISERFGQKRFVLDRMLESSGSYQYLIKRFTGSSVPEQCAALVLPESFEQYRRSLSKSTRQNIRTAINRAKRNETELRHILLLDEDDEIKLKISELNQKRLEKKSAASTREMSVAGRIYCCFANIYRKLFTAQLDVLHDSKDTFSFLVMHGDRLVSFFWGIRNDYLKEFYVILAGVDSEYEWYSPNISHFYQFVEEQYETEEKSIRILDFTRGGEGYKKTIGCTDRLVSSFYFKYSRDTLLGQMK